eukprot:1774986-Pleurochrysis_carterae.AAC.1
MWTTANSTGLWGRRRRRGSIKLDTAYRSRPRVVPASRSSLSRIHLARGTLDAVILSKITVNGDYKLGAP